MNNLIARQSARSTRFLALLVVLGCLLIPLGIGQLRANATPTAVLSHGPVVGAVYEKTARVFVRTDSAASVVIRYSPEPDLSIYLDSAAYATTANNDFSVQVPLSGLTGNTTYYLDVLVDGVPQFVAPYPQFKTFPQKGVATTFRFVILTDFKEADSGAVEAVDTWVNASLEGPDFVYIGGDFDHRNPTTYAEKAQMFKDLYTPANNYEDFIFEILRKYAVVHNWDDHDYGSNTADKFYPYRTRSLRVLSRYFPTYPMTNLGDWQAFSYAQADFFLLDSRAQRDPAGDPQGTEKSMLDGDNLGANGQLEWLKNNLLASTATWKFILTPVVWNPTNQTDAWSQYLDERQAIIDFINTNGITGVIFISGDRHAGAIDDGTNSDFPEMLVPSVNLNNCLSSGIPLGAWSEGTYGGENPPLCRGYGVVTVLTSPDRVTMKVKDDLGIEQLGLTITLP
ncbi:MAG: alkaline phosphatase D family protein [Chloroflexota bacterium]